MRNEPLREEPDETWHLSVTRCPAQDPEPGKGVRGKPRKAE